MDPHLEARLSAIEKKLDATFLSAEKTRKYILTITVITIVAFVLPIIGLVFAIPALLSSYSAIGNIGL